MAQGRKTKAFFEKLVSGGLPDALDFGNSSGRSGRPSTSQQQYTERAKPVDELGSPLGAGANSKFLLLGGAGLLLVVLLVLKK